MATPPKATTFEDAVAWFRAQVPITDDEYQALSARAQRQAFTVAGVAQLDIIQDVHTALEKAVANGTPLEEFKRDVGMKLRNAWAGTVAKPGYRLETIFRNGVQQAYGAGRYRQMTLPAVLEARPFWIYDSVLDSKTTIICRDRNGVILPASDPWWASNFPQSHHRCRAGVRNLTQAEAEKLGITTQLPSSSVSEGFGLLPDAQEWQPDLSKYPAPLRKILIQKHLQMAGELIPLPAGKISKAAALKTSSKMVKQAGFEAVEDAARFTKRGDVVTIAEFDQNDLKIYINTGHPYWKNVVAYSADRFAKRLWTTDNPFHVILHEIGHAKHHRVSSNQFGADRWQGIPNMPDEIKAISTQASIEGKLGWVAEVYVLLHLGKDVPEEVLVWYTLVGGPLP